MRELILSNGETTLLDDCDYEELSKFAWSRAGCNRISYAMRTVNKATIYMHRVIAARAGLNVEGAEVDHKDGNGLNNQRENLQILTTSQNQQKARAHIDGTSGERGVNWCGTAKKWIVRLKRNGVRLNIGSFDTLEEAVAARDRARSRW